MTLWYLGTEVLVLKILFEQASHILAYIHRKGVQTEVTRTLLNINVGLGIQ